MVTVFIHADIVDVINKNLIHDGSILVKDGTIKEIGTDITIPQNAKIMDLKGKTILPGLFNCHVHMCFDAGANVKEHVSQTMLTIQAINNLTTLLL